MQFHTSFSKLQTHFLLPDLGPYVQDTYTKNFGHGTANRGRSVTLSSFVLPGKFQNSALKSLT
jgi:hypothetical protein